MNCSGKDLIGRCYNQHRRSVRHSHQSHKRARHSVCRLCTSTTAGDHCCERVFTIGRTTTAFVHTELIDLRRGYVQRQIYTPRNDLYRKPRQPPLRLLTDTEMHFPKRQQFCIRVLTTQIYATVRLHDILGISTPNVLTGSIQLRSACASV